MGVGSSALQAGRRLRRRYMMMAEVEVDERRERGSFHLAGRPRGLSPPTKYSTLPSRGISPPRIHEGSGR